MQPSKFSRFRAHSHSHHSRRSWHRIKEEQQRRYWHRIEQEQQRCLELKEGYSGLRKILPAVGEKSTNVALIDHGKSFWVCTSIHVSITMSAHKASNSKTCLPSDRDQRAT